MRGAMFHARHRRAVEGRLFRLATFARKTEWGVSAASGRTYPLGAFTFNGVSGLGHQPRLVQSRTLFIGVVAMVGATDGDLVGDELGVVPDTPDEGRPAA